MQQNHISCHVSLHFDSIMVNWNLERHVTTEVFQARLSQRLLMETGTTVPRRSKVHKGFTDMVCMHQYSQRFVLHDRYLNGHSFSDGACGMALGFTTGVGQGVQCFPCLSEKRLPGITSWINKVFGTRSGGGVSVCLCVKNVLVLVRAECM